MSHLVRFILVVAGAPTLAAPRVQAPLNMLEVIVVNGPHAGTYKPPAAGVICMHSKKDQLYTAAWRDFNPHSTRAVGEARINVSNADEPGAKVGEVFISFGERGQNPTVYKVASAPLTLTIKGKGAEISFQDKTKDGIQLRVTAKCLDVVQVN